MSSGRESPIWADLVHRLRHGGQEKLVDWLRGVPLLSGLPRPVLRHLARHLHIRRYEDGEVVFRQGETGSGMYLVQKGRVRIVADLEPRGEVQLALLSEGSHFGEMSLFDDSPRSATALTQGETVLLGLFQGDLQQLERSRPQAANRFLRRLAVSLCERLRMTNERLADLEEGGVR